MRARRDDFSKPPGGVPGNLTRGNSFKIGFDFTHPIGTEAPFARAVANRPTEPAGIFVAGSGIDPREGILARKVRHIPPAGKRGLLWR
jgi:hypothetical protein